MSPRSAPARSHRPPTRPPRPTRRARWALGGWTALVGAALVGLVRAGDVLPPPPDPTRPGDTLRWLDLHGAPTGAFVVLRGAAILVAAYLLVATVLGVLARASGRRTLVRVVDAVTVARLRHFLRATATAGALSVPVLAIGAPVTAWAAGEPVSGPPPTIRVLTTEPTAPDPSATEPPPPAPTGSSTPPGRLPGIDPPVLRRLPAPVPAETITTTAPTIAPATTTSTSPTPTGQATGGPGSPIPPTADPPPPDPSPAPPSPPAGPDEHISPSDTADAAPAPAAPEGTWRIEPGDHLWRVAEQTLLAHSGQPPSDDATAAYLTRLVDANRDVLAVPDNPDLVFAGQVFLLPALPAN